MTRSTGTEGTTSRNAHLVRFEGVRLGSRRNPLLTELSLVVHPGQFLCLMIAPGALRRVLVRMLLGVARGHGGTIEWNRSFSKPSTATARIGFVPETFALPAGLSTTVREFVSLGLIGIAPGGASESQRIAWALEQVGLPGGEARDVSRLSPRERVSLLAARALARRPRFLVVEDPTAGLDHEAQDALLAVFSRLNRNERLSVAWFTTDVEVAHNYATHVSVPTEGWLRTAHRGDADFESVVRSSATPEAISEEQAPAATPASPFPSEATSDERQASAQSGASKSRP